MLVFFLFIYIVSDVEAGFNIHYLVSAVAVENENINKYINIYMFLFVNGRPTALLEVWTASKVSGSNCTTR
jgi:hypothetical protein